MSLREQTDRELLARNAEMIRDVTEYSSESAHAKRVVQRHGDVVLALVLGGEPEMAPGLSRGRVARLLERLGELVP